MQTEFNITRKSREIYSRFFDNFTPEQLNKVPQGFNNNLIWNIGHIVVSQQMLVYMGAGLEPVVSPLLIEKYKRGTKPLADAGQDEIDEIKNLLFTTVDKAETDYNNGLFTAYTERKTELGFSISSIEDAIAFNNYHEAIHLGIMMGIRKFV